MDSAIIDQGLNLRSRFYWQRKQRGEREVQVREAKASQSRRSLQLWWNGAASTNEQVTGATRSSYFCGRSVLEGDYTQESQCLLQGARQHGQTATASELHSAGAVSGSVAELAPDSASRQHRTRIEAAILPFLYLS